MPGPDCCRDRIFARGVFTIIEMCITVHTQKDRGRQTGLCFVRLRIPPLVLK
jgi:hypothetical protein